MKRRSPARPLLPLLAFAGLFACALQASCAEALPAEETISIAGYPDFTVAISPGIAPGLTDGCDANDPPTDRMLGRVYPIPLETRLIPDFRTLSQTETVCLDRLDVTPRRSVYPAFPGMRDRYRWFAVDLEGTFTVEHPGLYYFRLTSDDG
ncbi:MAG TPA: hypothetical protein VHS09_02495, partial [Polyangiaceae bacterium]|nr:hypothetical protein [Polyangiaceae bacterium]